METTKRHAGQLNRAARLLVWAGLVALGARRGGLLGALAVVYGADRLSGLAFGVSMSERLLAVARAARFERRQRYRFGEGTRDAVDEASWESFPASDPPAHSLS